MEIPVIAVSQTWMQREVDIEHSCGGCLRLKVTGETELLTTYPLYRFVDDSLQVWLMWGL